MQRLQFSFSYDPSQLAPTQSYPGLYPHASGDANPYSGDAHPGHTQCYQHLAPIRAPLVHTDFPNQDPDIKQPTPTYPVTVAGVESGLHKMLNLKSSRSVPNTT